MPVDDEWDLTGRLKG